MADYSDLFYAVSDGLTLYARDYPGPDREAPVLLCMHGLTRNSRDFAAVAPLFAQSHRVLVAEQRGRGRSDYDQQPARYQLPTYVGDMFELLSQQGITRCAALGTSMGGLMSMAMAAANPGLFSHVVLNDIGPVVAQEGLDRIKAYVGASTCFTTWEEATAYTRRINGSAFPHYSEADWRAFAANICVEDEGAIKLDYDPAIAQPMRDSQDAAVPPDLWPFFDALSGVPLMVIRGALSDLLDTGCVEEMQRRHLAMQYLEVPDVGHAPMLTEPDVAATIARFLMS